MDLHALVPGSPTDSYALSIDPAGNIAGYARFSDGSEHAVLWAVPEPSSFAAVVVLLTCTRHAARR